MEKISKQILWFFSLVSLAGISEGLCFLHFEAKRSLVTYFPYFFSLILLGILLILPLLRTPIDLLLIVGLLFLAQIFHDFFHVLTYGIVTGEFMFWGPYFPTLYFLDGIVGLTLLLNYRTIRK